MKCPHCNKEHSDDTKYCPNTGKEIELLACQNKKCPEYGKKILLPDSHYCPSCGKPLHNCDFLDFTVGGVSFRMIRVEKGTFAMGARSDDMNAGRNEKPLHTVIISRDYYLGETPVTQALWKAVMGSNPSEFQGNDNCPVESISWEDCQEFISKLNDKLAKTFRLPTEAEWEYAARGGNKSNGFRYSGSNNIDEVAWYFRNSEHTTHAVGKKKANELGLYDMSGNVEEWCQGWWGEYVSDTQIDPTGALIGDLHIARGGSCFHRCMNCRLSYRSRIPYLHSSSLGMRLVLFD